MEKLELFFIPSPLMGHAGQAVELAILFIKHFHHLTITVLVVKLPGDPIGTGYTDSLTDDNRIKFIHFPVMDPDLFQDCPTIGFRADAVINRHKPVIRSLVASRIFDGSGSGSDRESHHHHRLGALVIDMFCTPMIDVGNEFNVPTYVFFTSNAAFLGIMLHFQTLQDDQDEDIPHLVLGGSMGELTVPSYASPVPLGVVPVLFWDPDQWNKRFIRYTRRYREAKGIIVNTFRELEHHALGSYDDQTPPVYPVGPLLKPEKPNPNHEVLQWLKRQPNASVLLLCFGSRGCFEADQVREIAVAIERSGYRFIWSLRRPPSEEQKGFPGEYADYNEVLPDGFLERTAGKGKVLGWVPQTEVLADVATGGFVSHCGWNSILESLWYGVPVATWPIYAEQQLDAFQMVKDLGLAVEISLDYNQIDKNRKVVSAEEIEKGIREVMDGNCAIRAEVKEMRAKSRMAVKEGGSSFASLSRLVDDIMQPSSWNN
ncbi:hypothetical protein SSX86_017714 [Deinandra increscens subsp. villosa]|uniref:Glycosyltransferase n=1 Tax=Deinandra increscens subsp. villosa TaxID=3103831 RepID=A0AAP0D121_9ASTR